MPKPARVLDINSKGSDWAEKTSPLIQHQSENTDHLRAWRHLVDGVLASEMVLATLMGSCKGSHRGPTGIVSTIWFGGAKLSLSLNKEGPSLVKITKGLQTAAESTRGTMIGSASVGPLEVLSI